jgi:hypothetical protein
MYLYSVTLDNVGNRVTSASSAFAANYTLNALY